MEQSALPAGGRILLTGVTGQLGGELLKTLRPLGEVVAPMREPPRPRVVTAMSASSRRPAWPRPVRCRMSSSS